MIEKIQIWGSLQAHRVMENIEGGGMPLHRDDGFRLAEGFGTRV